VGVRVGISLVDGETRGDLVGDEAGGGPVDDDGALVACGYGFCITDKTIKRKHVAKRIKSAMARGRETREISALYGRQEERHQTPVLVMLVARAIVLI
jgi:hypothetical protein